MKNLLYYQSLQEYMDPEELYTEIVNLIRFQESNEALDQMESLYELSIRSENVDLPLDDFLRENLSKHVIGQWNYSSLRSTELCIMITFNFELRKVFNHLREAFMVVAEADVRQELQEAFDDAKSGPPPLKDW